MGDDNQNPAVTPPETPPASDTTPKVDPPATPADGASASGVDDIETFRKSHQEYEQAKPRLEAYSQFEKVLESDKEIAEAIENAIKGIADRRKGGAGAAPKVDAAPAVTPPAGTPQGDGEVTAVQLQNEMRFKDYVNEFVRVAKDAGITQDLSQEAFDGTVAEILRMNPDPLRNFDMAIVEKGFKSWNDKMDKIVKAKNDAYAKVKARDDVPAQGSGSAPKPAEQELTNPEDRRAFIEQGLRAANLH